MPGAHGHLRGAWRKRIARAVLASCRMDVQAMKPGNVSVHSPGHGMTARDFLLSADLMAPRLVAPGLSVGERVYACVAATQRHVRCNTNLGIILLCAPLVQAALTQRRGETLRSRLQTVLRALNKDDTALVFRAIRMAAPAGLGDSAEHDVRCEPTAGLCEAMSAAHSRDRIAYQYASGFEDIFERGTPWLREAVEGRLRDGLEWATIACYLRFLSTIPDTHIERKLGPGRAQRVREAAIEVETRFKACENLPNAMPLLQEFDNKLKRAGINPGTSADLTVASLLAFQLDDPRRGTSNLLVLAARSVGTVADGE